VIAVITAALEAVNTGSFAGGLMEESRIPEVERRMAHPARCFTSVRHHTP
jgi:hypothetical protein